MIAVLTFKDKTKERIDITTEQEYKQILRSSHAGSLFKCKDGIERRIENRRMYATEELYSYYELQIYAAFGARLAKIGDSSLYESYQKFVETYPIGMELCDRTETGVFVREPILGHHVYNYKKDEERRKVTRTMDSLEVKALIKEAIKEERQEIAAKEFNAFKNSLIQHHGDDL